MKSHCLSFMEFAAALMDGFIVWYRGTVTLSLEDTNWIFYMIYIFWFYFLKIVMQRGWGLDGTAKVSHDKFGLLFSFK